jgi:hypothetical protein
METGSTKRRLGGAKAGRPAKRKPASRLMQIGEFLRMMSGGKPFETRLLKCKRGNARPFTVAGYWDDVHAAAEALHDADQEYEPSATYITLNRIDPALLARAKNRLAEYLEPTTSDNNIVRRPRLLLDFDPVRPSGISSTDEELGLAIAAAERVRKWLTERHNWPNPIVKLNSGNGCHLVYAIDLPNDEESAALVQRVLQSLSAQFSDEKVKLDETVFNASRITKVAGTKARKGDDVAERPHRFAEVIWKAKKRVRVSVAKLKAVAALDTQEASTAAHQENQHHQVTPPSSTTKGGRSRLQVDNYLHQVRVEFEREDNADAKGRTHWKLKKCPFNPDHGGRESVIMQDDAGKMGFHCFHDHCAKYTWQDLKKKLGPPLPEHYDPPLKDTGFCNFRMVGGSDDDGGEQIAVGLDIATIAANLWEKTGGWPKRVGSHLFCQGEDGLPLWFDGNKPATKLFAWIDGQWKVNWKAGADKVSQERFYAHLQMKAEAFQAVEVVPHWPPLPEFYYMCPELPESDGSRLESLLDRFAPATHLDRELMKAFVLTQLWGGPPRARPAWAVIGPKTDKVGNGRGVGKSILIELLSGLVGGFLSFSTHDNIKEIKTRLLSPEARNLRVALLDNVKTHRFSWDDLEAMITAPVISGHELYQGEGRRPNTLIWAITMNGGKMSKDMAQRVMIIRVKRPSYDKDWEEETRLFIQQHRWEIIADAIKILKSGESANGQA